MRTDLSKWPRWVHDDRPSLTGHGNKSVPQNVIFVIFEHQTVGLFQEPSTPEWQVQFWRLKSSGMWHCIAGVSSSQHTGGLQGLYLQGQAVKEEDEGITVLWNIGDSVTSQMTWIFSNTAVRDSNLTGHLCLLSLLLPLMILLPI
jgi:hypothetical protein